MARLANSVVNRHGRPSATDSSSVLCAHCLELAVSVPESPCHVLMDCPRYRVQREIATAELASCEQSVGLDAGSLALFCWASPRPSPCAASGMHSVA